MPDLLQQNLSTVQSDKQPTVPTVASATLVAPNTKCTIYTGTAQLTTITPPVSGYHELTFIFTDNAPGAFSTGGNIITAYQPITNRPIDVCYIPTTGKYYVKAVV